MQTSKGRAHVIAYGGYRLCYDTISDTVARLPAFGERHQPSVEKSNATAVKKVIVQIAPIRMLRIGRVGPNVVS